VATAKTFERLKWSQAAVTRCRAKPPLLTPSRRSSFHHLAFLLPLCTSRQPQHFPHGALSQLDSHAAGGCLIQTVAPATFSQILLFSLVAPAGPPRRSRGSSQSLTANSPAASLRFMDSPQLALQFLFVPKNLKLHQNNCFKICLKRPETNHDATYQIHSCKGTLKSIRTTCTSEGTLDRKSSSSLLSIAYGLRSFFVNLLMPAKVKVQMLLSSGCFFFFLICIFGKILKKILGSISKSDIGTELMNEL